MCNHCFTFHAVIQGFNEGQQQALADGMLAEIIQIGASQNLLLHLERKGAISVCTTVPESLLRTMETQSDTAALSMDIPLPDVYLSLYNPISLPSPISVFPPSAVRSPATDTAADVSLSVEPDIEKVFKSGYAHKRSTKRKRVRLISSHLSCNTDSGRPGKDGGLCCDQRIWFIMTPIRSMKY